MIPLMGLAGPAISVFTKHWGKIIAAALVAGWAFATWRLYDEVGDLNRELGESGSAFQVCQAQRVHLDSRLLGLENQIALIQGENTKYKEDIAKANDNIDLLEESLESTLDELEDEQVPEDCEGAVDWLKTKALEMDRD